jgi:hypothetical protein
MASAPITVHPPVPSSGRRVTVHRSGRREESLGLAHSDHDLVVFLEAAGVDDAERVLDSPAWVQWRGAAAHEYTA